MGTERLRGGAEETTLFETKILARPYRRKSESGIVIGRESAWRRVQG